MGANFSPLTYSPRDGQLLRAFTPEAFRDVEKKGIYEEVLVHTGQRARHYALSDHKEYFAESTEAYLGVNDFYPFVRAELMEHDPTMYALLKDLWGTLE